MHFQRSLVNNDNASWLYLPWFWPVHLLCWLDDRNGIQPIKNLYHLLCRWGLLMWEIGRRLGHYGDHPHPQVVDRGTPSRVDKRVAPDREGAADKQCQGEGKLWSQYVITNCEEGKGKPPWLFPKTGYLLYSKRLKRENKKNWQGIS